MYKMKINPTDLRKYLTNLDGKELVVYRKGTIGERGQVQTLLILVKGKVNLVLINPVT